MYSSVRSRGVFIAGAGVILLTQAAAVCLAYVVYRDAFVTILIAALLTSAAAIAVCLRELRLQKAREHNDPELLAHWLENLDLGNPSAATPPAYLDAHDVRVASGATQLVDRILGYRDRLLARHRRVQRLLRNVTDVLYHADGDGRLTWITDSVADMLGYTPAQLIGRLLSDILVNPGEDFSKLINSTQLVRHPTRVYRRDGEIAWLLISSRRIDDGDGRAVGSEALCRDGTRLIETQRALDQEKERAQITLASIADGVITTNAAGMIDYLNPHAAQMLATTSAKASGLHFDDLCRLVDTDNDVRVDGVVSECVKTGKTREMEKNLTLSGRDSNKAGLAVKVTVSPIRDDHDAVTGTVIVLHDITRLQEISRELSHQANHDLVTGLPNRRACEQLLTRFLEDARDNRSEHALCYIDLDQFKMVNDTCGHDAGDVMLQQLTSQIAERLRASDTITRLGGDEFGVVMRNLPLATARERAEELRANIDTFRFHWQGKLFRLGASIGIAAITHDTVSVSDLLRRADTACYLAKEKGRNRVEVYHGDSDEAQNRHGDMQRMQQISTALDNDRFTLFAQIIRPLDPKPHDKVGVELLLRVRGEAGEILNPQNFLITAERYNAAGRIDRWVLREALRIIGAAQHQHESVDHYSINISGQSISDVRFVDYARKQIQASTVDPRRLVFEITETIAVTDTLRTGELIRSLRELGCRFSLDDFGSGLSSFSYLKDLPSDFIKIDGNLVSHSLDDPVESAIVEAINQIGQAIGLKTIAEHVESRELLDMLSRIGVDYVQGYYIAHPVPFAELDGLLPPPCAPGPTADAGHSGSPTSIHVAAGKRQ